MPSMEQLFPDGGNVDKSQLRQYLVSNVPTMAALRLLPIPENDGQPVYLLGYSNDGDGGGGFFTWVAASTATDDSGIIINPTGNVGAGRWVRSKLYAASPRWFGAVCDGTTDDTTAWNSALAGCFANNVRHLHVDGNIRITSKPSAITAAIEIFSDGQGVGTLTRDYTPVDPTEAFIDIQAYDVSIRHLSISSASGTSGGYAIKNHWGATSGAGDYIRLEDLYISAIGSWSRNISFDGTARTSLVGSRDIWINNCSLFRASESGLYLSECIAPHVSGVSVFDGGVVPSVAGLVVTGLASNETQYASLEFVSLNSASVEHTNGFYLSAGNAGAIALASTCDQGVVIAPRASSIINAAGPTKVLVISKDRVETKTITSGSSADLDLATSGGVQARIKHQSGAVNIMQMKGAVTGGVPTLSTTDSGDSNVWLGLSGKGTCGLFVDASGGGATPSFPSDYGCFIYPDSTGTVQMGSYSSGGTTDLELCVSGAAGTWDVALSVASDKTLDFKKSGSAASTPANFTATNYMTHKVNGVTVYIPYRTSAW